MVCIRLRAGANIVARLFDEYPFTISLTAKWKDESGAQWMEGVRVGCFGYFSYRSLHECVLTSGIRRRISTLQPEHLSVSYFLYSLYYSLSSYFFPTFFCPIPPFSFFLPPFLFLFL